MVAVRIAHRHLVGIDVHQEGIALAGPVEGKAGVGPADVPSDEEGGRRHDGWVEGVDVELAAAGLLWFLQAQEVTRDTKDLSYLHRDTRK